MDRNKKWKKSFRCLALVLVFAMLCSMGVLAAKTSNETEETYTTTISSIWTQNTFMNTASLTIDAYATSKTNEQKTVVPCDIVFVLDQSRWVNGDNGAERAEIINAMNALVSNLEQPTNGEEHRIAIAGYGRVNVSAGTDSYHATAYPGSRQSGTNYSLNTGYYTADNGFQSTKGWTEVSRNDDTGLPQMPTNYKNAISYDSAFMSVAEAEDLLNPDKMLAWYSGASRMDAGLTIAEQLATVANDHDQDEERNLIVCVVASSLPIQNYGSYNKIRSAAVKTASDQLKSMGATIFALGDYHNAGKNMSDDTLSNFEDTMTTICGSSETTDENKADYFFSRTKSGSVVEALNEMVTSISTTVAESVLQNVDIKVDSVTTRKGVTVDKDTWLNWVKELIKTDQDAEAVVEYYDYTGTDYGEPEFSWEPYIQTTVPLTTLLTEYGTLQYTAQLIPLPNGDTDGSTTAEGNKVTITITTLATIYYKWLEDGSDYIPGDVSWPASEVVSSYSFYPEDPQTADVNYQFEGWYYDEDAKSPVDSAVTPYDEMILYGKWGHYAYVRYHETAAATVDEAITVRVGDTLTTYRPKSTEDDYRFEGWYTDATLTTPFVDGTSVTDDLDLYAKWVESSDKDYSILYYQQNLNDDQYAEVIDDAEYLYGTTGDTISITKAYTGFTQSKVTYASDSNEESETALPIQADGSLVVSVYYDRDTYTVSYDLNGGTGADGVSYADATVKYGGTATAAAAPTKTGYTFTGWSDGTTAYQAGSSIKITSDVTLKAQWSINTCSVAFNANEGSGTMDSQDFTYGTAQNLTENAFTRAGYIFAGWNTRADGTGTGYADQANVSNLTTEKNGTVTLYAQWTPNTYAVVFEANEGTGTMDSQSFTYGTAQNLTENAFTRTGYTFAGWNTKSGGTGTPYADGTEVSNLTSVNGGTVLLYAQWTPSTGTKYTVQYYQQNLDDDNYAYVTAAQRELTGTTGAAIDTAISGIGTDDTTYTGFTWKETTYAATNVAAQTTALPIQADGSLVVSVYYDRIRYKVSYDLDGGTGADGVSYADATIKYGGTTTAAAAPTKTGYTFTGWSDGTTAYQAGSSIKITSDVTLKAQWSINTYSVAFNANEGSGTMDSQDFTYGTAQNLTENAFTRTGYTFTGWNTRADGTGTGYADQANVSNLTTEKNGTVTLYAQWTPITYAVAFEANEGTGTMENQSFTYDAAQNLTENAFTRTGYTFTGWKDSAGNTYTNGQSVSNLSTESSAIVTLYAQWTPVVRPVTTPAATPTVTEPETEPGEEAAATSSTSTVSELLKTQQHVSYIEGYEDGTVRPNRNITRAEVATVFFRLLTDEAREEYRTTENSFTDVSDSAWYCEEVSTMANMGIMSGRTETIFDPDTPITRAELAVVCARFDTSDVEGVNRFSDIEGHWAQADIERAAALGWLEGYEDGTFRPDRYITRAETMTLINRVLDRVPENEDQFPADKITWPDNQDKSKWYYLDVQEATNTYESEKKATE